MESKTSKGFIIRMSLPDAQLEKLISLTDNAGISMSDLFGYFIEDLTSENSKGSIRIEDWLYSRTGCKNKKEEEDEEFELVNFKPTQVEIMNLLDLILDE